MGGTLGHRSQTYSLLSMVGMALPSSKLRGHVSCNFSFLQLQRVQWKSSLTHDLFLQGLVGEEVGSAGREAEGKLLVTCKIIFELIYKLSHGKWAFKWQSMLLHAAISLLPIHKKCPHCTLSPPTSEQWTGTFWRHKELNQHYISPAISQTSEIVHSHWLLEAQGARGGLVI